MDDAVRPLAARRCARHAMHEAGGRSGHRMAQQPHVQLCGERAQSRVRDLKLIEHLRREASMCSIKLNQAHRAPEEGGKHVLNQAQSSSIKLIEHLRREASMCSIKLNQAQSSSIERNQ